MGASRIDCCTECGCEIPEWQTCGCEHSEGGGQHHRECCRWRQR